MSNKLPNNLKEPTFYNLAGEAYDNSYGIDPGYPTVLIGSGANEQWVQNTGLEALTQIAESSYLWMILDTFLFILLHVLMFIYPFIYKFIKLYFWEITKKAITDRDLKIITKSVMGKKWKYTIRRKGMNFADRQRLQLILVLHNFNTEINTLKKDYQVSGRFSWILLLLIIWREMFAQVFNYPISILTYINVVCSLFIFIVISYFTYDLSTTLLENLNDSIVSIQSYSVGILTIKELMYGDMFIFTVMGISALLFALIAVAIIVRKSQK